MARRDLAVHRVVPADQGFRAALPLRGKVVLRLVDDLELLPSQREPEFMLDHAAALQSLVHALLEEAHALPAVALGARQGDAGMAEDYRRGVSVGRRKRDADAGGDQHFLAGHLKRPAQGLDQAVHEGHDVAQIGDVDQGDGEFVAAQPRDEVALAQRRLNAGADVPQNLIAAAVIGGFVDLLELIDVQAEHGDMGPVPMHARHGVGEAFAEGFAIGKAGEGVVLLEIADLRLGSAVLTLPHPSKGGGHGDAGADQEQRDGADQSEIAGKHTRLVALVEIDDERTARLSVQCEWKRESGKVGGGR